MGSSRWSDDFYSERARERKATGTADFAYSKAVTSKPRHEQKTHEKLDPKGVRIRESRDSAAHPESLAIGVMLDVTGSMSHVPVIVQSALPKLMGMLTGKGIVAHPQILFGAVGDARSDRGSLQVGQFESGIEMDEDLRNFWLENGGGGGEPQESYQNAVYFFARHTSTDCFEKRGKKGFLFLMGDERPYPNVLRSEIQAICGDGLEADISTAEIVREAQAKYHVFYIMPDGTSHAGDPSIIGSWTQLLGADHVLRLTDAAFVCETIAATIGLTEGTATLQSVTEGLVGRAADVVQAVVRPLATQAGRVGTAAPAATVARL